MGRLGALLDAAANPTILARVGRGESANFGKMWAPYHLDWATRLRAMVGPAAMTTIG